MSAAPSPSSRPSPPATPPGPGFELADVYYLLFRHKWKILLCSILGLGAAAAYFFLKPPPYQSEARLFVRFVITESNSLRPGDDAVTKSPDQRGETIMNSEVQILTSMDLARQVAQVIGAPTILGDVEDPTNLNAAADRIRRNLGVEIPARSSVIRVSFQHPDPQVVQPVLREIVDQYLRMHLSVHRAAGMVGDFLTQETDLLRTRLAQTEEELRKANAKAGVISLESAKTALSDQMVRLRQELFHAQAEFAERSAILQQVGSGPTEVAEDIPAPAVGADVAAEHRRLTERIALLEPMEQQLLTQFTPENSRVQQIRAQLETARDARLRLETDHPQLTRATVLPGQPRATSPTIDVAAESARLAALQSRIKVLNAQLDQVRTEAATVDQMEVAIMELRRRKELEESNYRRYAASLEHARINEALGAGKVSNISQIQAPSPPAADTAKVLKAMLALAVAGVGGGLAWAFLLEYYLDRSVKRPVDVERKLRLPLLLSVPHIKSPRRKRRSNAKALPPAGRPEAAAAPSTGALAAPGETSDLKPFHDAIGDRLIGYFESANLTHKPKLVAVTGLARGSGVSSVAAGLSRALSETGDGNVLLVDMARGQGAAQQFLNGKPMPALDEVFDRRQEAHVQENLFVVSENDPSERLSRNLPQRFSKLVPKLKASDFDYIIFDMPPVGQLSITPRLSSFMDMVIIVIEAEQTSEVLAHKALDLLAPAKTHVSVVLNKTRSYVPSLLHQEL